LLATALRYCREQTTPKNVVTFVCDTGTRYLTKVYSNGWMADQGLLVRPKLGDLRDLIGRRFDEGDVVSVAPSDTLMTAFNRMRSADLAQLPVIDNGRLAGIIDESDLLLHVANDPAKFQSLVGSTMTAQLQTLAPSASMAQLRETLDHGLTAVISDEQRFYGLITRFDLLNHLRRTVS
jgi:cystathionine beta-synthase